MKNFLTDLMDFRVGSSGGKMLLSWLFEMVEI